MIRPNSRLAAGALLLCVAAGGWGEEGKSARPAGKPHPILPPSSPESFEPGKAPALRPEATTRLIPVIPAQSRPLPAQAREQPASAPLVPKAPEPGPKGVAPAVAKETTKPKNAPSARVGRAALREIDEAPAANAAARVDEAPSPKKPTAIDPKEMAPMDASKGKVLPIRPVAGAVVSPESALTATASAEESVLTPTFVRKSALNAGLSKPLADQVAAIIGGASNGVTAEAKDRWVIEACQSLKEYPEAERVAAFQEILRVYQRKRASEASAAEKRQ